jgi:hypothetical protein
VGKFTEVRKHILVTLDVQVKSWVYRRVGWSCKWKRGTHTHTHIQTHTHTHTTKVIDCVWNVMAHAQKPDFVFRRNGPVHLNRQGRQFSRLLAAEVCASEVVILDTPCSEIAWSVLATHSIRQISLHLPSRASPCAITFQLDSTPINRVDKMCKEKVKKKLIKA